jgi:hypothetical protein
MHVGDSSSHSFVHKQFFFSPSFSLLSFLFFSPCLQLIVAMLPIGFVNQISFFVLPLQERKK